MKCPACGEVNRDDALMCGMCKAVLRRVGSKQRLEAPAGAAAAGPLDFTAIAEQVASRSGDPYFGGFGLAPDFSAASLFVLDAFFDALWGPDGEAPDATEWQPTPSKQQMTVQFGSYLGETLRRLWGGQWRTDPRGTAWATVTLPGGIDVVPLAKVLRRFKNGRKDALFPLFVSLRERLGSPKGERESYAAHAQRLRARQVPEEAQAAMQALERLARGETPESERAGTAPDVARARRELEVPAFAAVVLDGSRGSVIAIDAAPDASPPALESGAEALMAKADAVAATGDASEAIAAYRRVLEVAPAHAEARRQLAICFSMTGQNDAALVEFDALVAAHPDHPDAADNRATLLVRMGRFEEALQAFNQVIARAPEASPFKRRGFCLASMGRREDALADYVRSVELDPHYAEGWVFRAEMEETLGRVEDAKRSWRAGLAVRDWSKLGPRARPQAHRKLWRLENPGGTLNPDAAEPLRQQAFMLAGRARFAEALPLLEQALALDPLDPETWHNKGATLLSLGRREEALAALRRADTLDSLPSRAALARLQTS